MKSMETLLENIKGDVYRWQGKYSLIHFIKSLLSRRGFRFLLFMRLAKHFRNTPILNIIFLLFYKLFKIVYASDVNFRCSIGTGCRLHHVIGTTWGPNVVIGNNVTIAHGVTIAGKKGKSPIIGDRVYLGAYSMVLGVNVGDGAVIGAGAVVVKPVPKNAIVAGNPARIISYKESAELIDFPYELGAK